MTPSDEDPSMLLHGFAGTVLADRELALVMAESIFRRVYGDADFEIQKPLHVADAEDRWLITGNRQPDRAQAAGDLAAGAVEIAILKSNCRVAHLIQKAIILPSGGE